MSQPQVGTMSWIQINIIRPLTILMAYFKDLLNQEFERFSKQFRRFCNSISLFCCFLNILQELRYFFIPPMPDSNFDRSWKLTFQCFRQHKTCLVCILKNLGCLLPHCATIAKFTHLKLKGKSCSLGPPNHSVNFLSLKMAAIPGSFPPVAFSIVINWCLSSSVMWWFSLVSWTVPGRKEVSLFPPILQPARTLFSQCLTLRQNMWHIIPIFLLYTSSFYGILDARMP